MGLGPTLEEQRASIREYLAAVKELHPHAAGVNVTTSDQNDGYGFVTCSFVLSDGSLLGIDALFDDDLEDHLRDLDWDSLVGEDRHGDAVLVIADWV